LLAERRSGHTLPQPLYVDPQVFDFDLQAIFHRCWLLGGLETQIPRSGDYLTLQVGESPLLLIRNTDGGVSGFFNTCRHRGAQICREQRGHARRLVCPYHQWTYDLRGQLLQAGRMHAGFDCSAYSLRPVRVETIAGLIYFCLSDTPPDFSAFRAALAPMLEPHELHNAKVAHTAVLVERANWKLAMENARECYHCRAGHPQLMRSYSDFTGAELTGRTAAWLAAFNARCESHGLASSEVIGSWFEVGRYPLADGVVSYTMDGRQAVAKKLGRVGDGDVGTLWWAAQPNAFHHVVGDYAFFFQALPTGPQQTTVTAKWIVHKDAIEGVDYDLSRLTEVWDATNTQDRALAEYNQCGVNSAAYVPGPYSGLTEQLLIRFVDWYCAEAEAFLDSKAATGLSVS
jgi:Rieske 2Fe-2S family protein